MESVIRFIGFIAIGIGAFVVVAGIVTSTGFAMIPWAIAAIITGILTMGFAKLLSLLEEIRDSLAKRPM